MLIGFWIAGLIADRYKTTVGHDWQMIWMIPAGIAAAIGILFLAFFREPKNKA
jgi:hypothetical protein